MIGGAVVGTQGTPVEVLGRLIHLRYFHGPVGAPQRADRRSRSRSNEPPCVSWPRLALGCGNFGGIGSAPAFFGKGSNEEEAWAIMDAAWAAGIRWFDTADAYGGGRSESYIGRWRADRRPEGLLVTTKVFNPVTGDPADRGLAPDRIRRNVEGSLERLGVERIDLYLAHDPDPDTPLAETVGAFEELRRRGHDRRLGAQQLRRGRDRGGARPRPAGGRPELVLAARPRATRRRCCRSAPSTGSPTCRTARSPAAGSPGKYARGAGFPEGSRMTMRPEPYEHLVADRVFDGLDRARRRGRGARRLDGRARVRLGALASRTSPAAVCGPSRPEHLEPVLAALDVPLSPDERDRIGSFFA